MSEPSEQPAPGETTRLDQALVRRGLARSRVQARDLVRAARVHIDGIPATKPATLVRPDAEVGIDGGLDPWVGRGAVKLLAALDAFDLVVTGRRCLDVGASTGGFTQVLLERGARRVIAVDVGRGQLHASVAADARVVNLEGTDARILDAEAVGVVVEAIVADVSFISLTKALPGVMALAAPGCWLAALVKPQFELSPAEIGKGGIVKDPADGPRALAAVADWIGGQAGWRVIGTMPSPLPGKDGNQEYLVGAVHRG